MGLNGGCMMRTSRDLFAATVLLLLLCGEFAFAQDSRAADILAQVVKKNRERQAMLGAYCSDRVYRIEYRGVGGLHTARMEVHAEYRAPGVKHFTVTSETGSKAFGDKVLRRLIESEEESSKAENQVQMMVSADKYDATLVGREAIRGVNAWVLDVKPKEPSKFNYDGRIWVSQDDLAIMRVVGHPAKNPSWLVNRTDFDSEYQRVGIFWLMAKNTTVSHVRVGGEATLTIDYGKYTVDTLPEKVQTARVVSEGH
ncbi:outer membrane lipoprotein-sorting protein [Granulicella pectinivorans]|uniref:Outer membrane lipoprotein-sorting protein n=2 Tax=Granulicella pectinivorans TaxID=474950 RepID=A0A1I6MYI8_9BACT|nr:outer membrane lipoprotein-sorting protein [Granulicella pectinivorans]